MDAELERELQAERIRSRQDWVRYIELKTSLYRTHVAHVEDELAAIRDALWRHERSELRAHGLEWERADRSGLRVRARSAS